MRVTLPSRPICPAVRHSARNRKRRSMRCRTPCVRGWKPARIWGDHYQNRAPSHNERQHDGWSFRGVRTAVAPGFLGASVHVTDGEPRDASAGASASSSYRTRVHGCRSSGFDRQDGAGREGVYQCEASIPGSAGNIMSLRPSRAQQGHSLALAFQRCAFTQRTFAFACIEVALNRPEQAVAQHIKTATLPPCEIRPVRNDGLHSRLLV